MQPSEYDQSKIGFLFGEDVDTEGKGFVNVKLQINKAAANRQSEYLNKSTNFKIDVNWTPVIQFKVGSQKKAQVISLLETFFNKDPEAGTKTSEIHKGIRQLVNEKKINPQISSSAESVFLSLKFDPQFEEEVVEPFQQFMPMGLEKVAEKQLNIIEVVAQTNLDVKQILKDMDQGEKLVSVLFKNLRVESNLKVHNQFGDEIKAVLENFDAEFANSPPILFLRYFKMLDLDFRFFSTDELPDQIQRKILPGPQWVQGDQFQQFDYPLIQEFLLNVTEDIQVYFTIQDFLAFEAKCHLPGWSEFFLRIAAARYVDNEK